MMTNINKKFLNPETVLFQAGLKAGQNLTDLGAGSGHYAIAGAKIVGENGSILVIDVKESALDHVAADARMNRIKTIKTLLWDLDQETLTDRAPFGHSDMVLLANILHEVGHRKNLLAHAYKLLKTGGRMLIIDWNESPSPIGPPVSVRVSESDTKKLCESSSFRFVKNVDTDQYHFGLLFEK